MKTLGYVRVSTSMQVEKGNSIDNQVQKIKEYAKLENLELIQVFEDLGVSGKKAEREGYQNLIKYALDNDIHVVVVWSLSRLGRNLRDMLDTIDIFRKSGIELRAIKENIKENDAISNLLLNIMGSINEFEVAQLGERIKVVKNHNKDKGLTYGRTQYGFKNDNGKIVKDENEYKVRLLIKRLRRKDYSYKSIAEELEYRGIKSRSGGKFFASTIRNMFNSVEVKVA